MSNNCLPWIAALILGTLAFCYGVPLNVMTAETDLQDLSEVPEELVLDEDDSTTHTLERLVSAATCLVAGVEYTHGQQIYRADPCEFCLCLDGEMFCWWQDCPPVAAGPCKDRRPFSPCANGKTEQPPVTQSHSQQMKQQMHHRSSSSVQTAATHPVTEAVTTVELESTWVTDNGTTADVAASVTETAVDQNITQTANDNTSTHASPTTTSAPLTCIVMGVEYKIGEMLPHDTGNCLECVCGQGARVRCSPHLCAPPDDGTAEFRAPGLRPDLPDAF